VKTVITSSKENPLIGRREIKFEIEQPSTPTRAEVRRDIAVSMKTELEYVWIRKMETVTGTHRTVGLAHIYTDAEHALKVEPAHIVKKHQENKTEETQ
jgi:ribosomal protein S24E